MTTKYTREILQDAVNQNKSMSGVLRTLGIRLAGGNHTHIKKMIDRYEIDTSHFTGKLWNKGCRSTARKPPEEVLVIWPEGSNRPKAKQLRNTMLDVGVKYECLICKISDWNGIPLVLEVDHINRNWLDNRIENLRFLCPNCHSQE
jgi:hypothetical protein